MLIQMVTAGETLFGAELPDTDGIPNLRQVNAADVTVPVVTVTLAAAEPVAAESGQVHTGLVGSGSTSLFTLLLLGLPGLLRSLRRRQQIGSIKG